MSSLHIVLFQPEIPENTGAIGRTCVAADAKLHLVRPLGFQLDQRRLQRAGMDYWAFLDYQIHNDWNNLNSNLPGRRWYFSRKAVKCYSDVDFAVGDVLVFGSESRGLPDHILDSAPEQCVAIPMQPIARSLNLSVSVGIAVYEAKRQIGFFSKKV